MKKKKEKKQEQPIWINILKLLLVIIITFSYMAAVFSTTPLSEDKAKTLAWVLIVILSCIGYFKFLDWMR